VYGIVSGAMETWLLVQAVLLRTTTNAGALLILRFQRLAGSRPVSQMAVQTTLMFQLRLPYIVTIVLLQDIQL
jgi:hypothetical protein